MESPPSLTTESLQPRRLSGTGARGTLVATSEDLDAACSDEQPSRGPWPSEAPPSGVLTGVLGELAFYYGACWLHYRSAQPRGKTR